MLTEAAKVLHVKPVGLSRILALRQPLPATRTATVEEASEITDALRAVGIESSTVPSHELHLEELSKKVYALEFSNEALTATLVGSNARVSAGWDELILLVTGRLLLSRVGKFDTATVTTTDNEDQFTRYSRLRHYLRKHA